MSMILGFPHASDPEFSDRLAMSVLLQGQGDTSLKMRALRRVVALAAARINDRNALGTDNDLDATRSIQDTLNRAGSAMPPEWWDVEAHANAPEQKVAYEHLMTHLWFWQIQVLLHLPLMLKDNRDERHAASSGLCLQGCRNMLHVFSRLRGDPALSVYICSCEDFQGVLTACMLLVGILSRISRDADGNYNSFEDEFAVLEDVKDIFRYRSQQQGGSIAKQGLKAIETLESFIVGDPSDYQQPQQRAIVLPYFGLINVEARIAPRPNQRYEHAVRHMNALPTPPADNVTQSSFQDHVPVPAQVPDFDFNFALTSATTCTLGDSSIDWDQFFHGEELAQNWDSLNDVLHYT